MMKISRKSSKDVLSVCHVLQGYLLSTFYEFRSEFKRDKLIFYAGSSVDNGARISVTGAGPFNDVVLDFYYMVMIIFNSDEVNTDTGFDLELFHGKNQTLE